MLEHIIGNKKRQRPFLALGAVGGAGEESAVFVRLKEEPVSIREGGSQVLSEHFALLE